MQILAEQGNDVEAGLTMFAQETQQIFPLHQRNLSLVEQFGRNLVWHTGKRGAKPEYFSGDRDPKRQAFAGFRTDRQLRSAFAQDEDSARRLAFPEEHGISEAHHVSLDGVKILQCAGRKIAEEPVGAQHAVETAL